MQSRVSNTSSFLRTLPSDTALYRRLMLNCRDDWQFCDSYPSYDAKGMDVCIFPGHPAERQVHFDYSVAEYVRMLDLLELTERADRMRTNRPGRLFRWFSCVERQHSRPELNLPVYWHGRRVVIDVFILAACCFIVASVARFFGLPLPAWTKNVLECCCYAVFAIVYFGLAECTVATWQEWRAWPTEVWSKVYLAYRARLAYTVGIACLSVIASILSLCHSGCLAMPKWVSGTLTLLVFVLSILLFICSVVSIKAIEYNAQEPLRLQERMRCRPHDCR